MGGDGTGGECCGVQKILKMDPGGRVYSDVVADTVLSGTLNSSIPYNADRQTACHMSS